jgi:hypothetical protein
MQIIIGVMQQGMENNCRMGLLERERLWGGRFGEGLRMTL